MDSLYHVLFIIHRILKTDLAYLNICPLIGIYTVLHIYIILKINNPLQVQTYI